MSRHKGFAGGAVLPDDKDLTENSPIEEITAPSVVQVVLDDGAGGTAEPSVQIGQKVQAGQGIGSAREDYGVGVHSSVCGIVRQMETVILADGGRKPALTIEADTFCPQNYPAEKRQWKLHSEGLIECLKWAGISQMSQVGGSLVGRIRKAVRAGLRWLIINGVESEPLITAEARLMTEQADQIAKGCALLSEIFSLSERGGRASSPRGLMAICGLRHQALGSMKKALKGGRFRLAVLADVYPQDEEMLLANTLTRSRCYPPDDPADAGILIINVSSLWALSRAWFDGQPVIDRVITLSGDGTERIGNYRVRIGSSIKGVIKQAGILPEANLFISGGPFRGWGRPQPEGIITKQTTGLTVLSQSNRYAPEACIRCGWCIEDCPVQIDPIRLYRLVEAGRVEQAQKAHLEVCIECGLCSYVCPTHLPLLQKIRTGKWAVKQGQSS